MIIKGEPKRVLDVEVQLSCDTDKAISPGKFSTAEQARIKKDLDDLTVRVVTGLSKGLI